MVRSEIEIKRLKRLKKGQIIHIQMGLSKKVIKAKVINNFKNAEIIDFKIVFGFNRFLSNWFEEYFSKDYEWNGFTITLKEDLI